MTRKTQKRGAKGGKRRNPPRNTRFNRTMKSIRNAIASTNVPSDSTKLKRMTLLNVTNQDMNRILKEVKSMKK